MSIARHNGRMQVCCDNCPASYPNTYVQSDFTVMVADAKAAGWTIRKVIPADARDTSDLFGSAPRIAGTRADPFTHICPDCSRGNEPERFF